MECIIFLHIDNDGNERAINWNGNLLIAFPQADGTYYLSNCKLRASKTVGKGNWIMRKATIQIKDYVGS